jgi:hypothetical protein
MFRHRDPEFDGDTYEPAKDQARLTGQLARVKAAMADGHWHTLPWLATTVQGSEAGVSARLRDLRKPKFGGTPEDVKRRRVSDGLFEYRWMPRKATPAGTVP